MSQDITSNVRLITFIRPFDFSKYNTENLYFRYLGIYFKRANSGFHQPYINSLTKIQMVAGS
ncbi:MAG: hypothetical protein JWR44_1084 [Hymenobacter sp.]|jgi:hypothetical protein|nr:hypothetical protein [Hymenobacter sp.]